MSNQTRKWKLIVLKLWPLKSPRVDAWLRSARHSADGFATMRRRFSPLVKWRGTRGLETSLRTGGTPQSVAAVCRGRREAAGSSTWGSGVPASSGSYGASPVSGWRLRGWRCASPLWRRTPALGRPGGPSLDHGRGASDRRNGRPPLLWWQRGGAVAALDRGRISSRWQRTTTRWWWRWRPGIQIDSDLNTFL